MAAGVEPGTHAARPNVIASRLATIRFGVEWSVLNQLERAGEFDVPMLLLVGGADPLVDPTTTEEFAEEIGERAAFSRFEQARHADLWNVDQVRYEATIAEWLFDLLGPE